MPLFGLGRFLKGKTATPEDLRALVDARGDGWDEAVMEALSAKDPELRAEAARMARHLPPEAVAEHLIPLLRDSARPVVMAVLDTIGVLRLGDAVPAVSGLLGSTDHGLKEEVARCMARLGGTRGASAILGLLDVPRLPASAERAVTDLGLTAIPVLMSAILDGRRWVRQNATLLLGELGDRRAVPSLMVALNDADTGVRVAAVDALGRLGGADAAAGLISALGDTQDKVRLQAASALGKLGDARAVVPLIARFSDPERHVRDQAVKALADIGAPAADALVMSLREDDPGVREYAAKALSFVLASEATEPLIYALEDSEWSVRRFAAEALGKLGAKSALPYLLAAKDDPIDFVRERARQALDRIDPSGELRKGQRPVRRRGDEKITTSRATERPREPGMPGVWALDLPEAYTVLGLALDANRSEVRSAWKILMRKYHPDAVAHLTADERARTEEEAKRVNMAYDTLMKALTD